jgi:heat shock 70kDa protein 1/2/6/8
MTDIENPEELSEEHIIGIDLGTTNTCVGIWRDGNMEIIPDEYGNRTIPSIVAYTNINKYVGIDAKNQKELNSENVFSEVKRFIGRKIDDPLVVNEKHLFSYAIENDEYNNIVLKPNLSNNKIITPEEISASVLTKAKQIASNYLHTKITKCVITVPALFNDGQRQATKDAATIAGLECIRILNEPVAATLAYGLLKRSISSDEKTVIVYDFGGGTLDVSVVNIDNGIFDTLASGGNSRLGGSDFDNRLMDYCIKKFSIINKIKLESITSIALQKLRTACEQAKKILSTSIKTYIAVKNFYEEIDLCIQITRDQLEEKICFDLFLMCMKPVEDVLKKCDKSIEEIDEIILVGGMTRMPKIKELLHKKFQKAPNCTINPDEAIAAGAAIQGYLLSHNDDPFPDTVTLLNTTAFSLGVETQGGLMDVIIERGSYIPYEANKEYSTDEDYVTSVIIKIFEGERKMTKDNLFIGEFELKGFKPQLRGLPEINVKFDIDENGIIKVTATNKKTDDNISIIVTGNKGRLSKDAIDQLIEKSLEYEFQDSLEHNKKMLHYNIDEYCSNILFNLKYSVVKFTEEDKKNINDDVIKILSWLKEKKYSDREEDEYEKVISNIKKQYNILILKGNTSSTVIKALETENQTSTKIYENDESEDDEVEKIKYCKLAEDEENGFTGLSDPEKAELKELRTSIINLCNSIFDILTSTDLKILENHIIELRDYISDCFMWIHSHEQPTQKEYKQKFDEINVQCELIFNQYNGEIFQKCDLVESLKTKKDELENLCYILDIMISDNKFIINKCSIDNLQKIINDNISWIDENLSNDDDEFYNQCSVRLDHLTNMCNKLEQSTHNISSNVDLFGNKRDEKIKLTGYYEEMQNNNNEDIDDMGSDIITILRRKQQSEIDALINQDE